MKRLIGLAVVAYVGLALLGHARERSGALRCECAEGCWCKRPGLNLFRWVFPYGHTLD